MREREGQQEAILKSAKRIHIQRDAPTVDVILYWSAFGNIREHAPTIIAREIATLVYHWTPPLNCESSIDYTVARMPHGVDRIVVRRYDMTGAVMPDNGNWYAPRAAFPPNLEPEHIQERLTKKERALAGHEMRYQQRWLALALAREGPSTWGQIPDEVLRHSFISNFDRAFVIGIGDQFAELRLGRAVEHGVAPDRQTT